MKFSTDSYINNVTNKFSADSYIEIGSSHNICEDYALNGMIDGVIPYIIVSDGCSSSKLTDFGSRIMAHSCRKALIKTCRDGTLNALKEDDLRKHILLIIKHTAMETAERFELPYNICDATLLYAFIYNGIVYVHGYGDGNIILKMKSPDEHTKWINLKYDSNAPFYISYLMDSLRKKGYEEDENFGGKLYRQCIYYSDGPPTTTSRKYDMIESMEFPVNSINSITLSSDGMESYSHSNKRLCENPTPPEEEIRSLKPFSIMQRMVAYKNFQGEFVKRRMKRMKQEIEKIQGEHFDDVSCATIWIEHGE